MKLRVSWTQEERTLLVREVVRLRRETLTESMISLVNQAQKVLSADRRRVIKTLQSVGDWFLTSVKREWEATKEVVEIPVEVVVEVPQSIKTIPTAHLLTELIMRLAGKIDQIERLIPTEGITTSSTLGQMLNPPQPRQIKPKVLVAGLRQDQMRLFEERLGREVDFSFVVSDNEDHAVLPTAVNRVYLICKFASHSLQQRMRDKYNGAVHLHHGGLVSLVETIAKDLHIIL